jgi:predicted metal-dependent enzyme (double-stranded beta helix superfamily)
MAAVRTTSSGAACLKTRKAVSRGAASLRQGDVTVLGRDIIHSVTNPLDKVSYAIHVYDGDFLSAEGKSCWHAETLCEMPYDADAVSPAFGQALTSR